MAHADRLTLRALSLSSCGRDTTVVLSRVTARAELILAEREGLLGAARLAPSGAPYGRSTSPPAKLSNRLFVCQGFE
jgi:hypothetical protein